MIHHAVMDWMLNGLQRSRVERLVAISGAAGRWEEGRLAGSEIAGRKPSEGVLAPWSLALCLHLLPDRHKLGSFTLLLAPCHEVLPLHRT